MLQNMLGLQIHLVLNHLPIFCLLFALPLSLWSWYKKNESFFFLALILSGLAGLSSLLVTFSGESAYDFLKLAGSVEHRAVQLHENAAEQANIATILVAIAALGSYFFSLQPSPAWKRNGRLLYAAVLILAIVLMVRAAHLGGQIRRPELRAPAALSL